MTFQKRFMDFGENEKRFNSARFGFNSCFPNIFLSTLFSVIPQTRSSYKKAKFVIQYRTRITL